MTLVKRDPFARTELHKTRFTTSAGCNWCDRTKRTKAGTPYLYQFENQSDGGRNYTITGLFCSVSCMRAYHNN